MSRVTPNQPEILTQENLRAEEIERHSHLSHEGFSCHTCYSSLSHLCIRTHTSVAESAYRTCTKRTASPVVSLFDSLYKPEKHLLVVKWRKKTLHLIFCQGSQEQLALLLYMCTKMARATYRVNFYSPITQRYFRL